MAKITRGTAITASFFIIVTTVIIFIIIKTTPAQPTTTTEHEAETPPTVYIADDIPPNMRSEVGEIISSLDWTTSEEKNTADVTISHHFGTGDACSHESSLFQIFTLSVPFTQMLENPGSSITHLSDSVDISSELDHLNDFAIDVDEDSMALSLELIQDSRPDRYTIAVDGADPFNKTTWSTSTYPLISQVCIESGNSDYAQTVIDNLSTEEFLEDSGYLTSLPVAEDFVTVFKTGTSVSGGPGWFRCERLSNIDYPILVVAPKMLAADIAIISNESSFVEGCTQQSGTTAFCGKPAYLQNLLDMGIDIISLTGNHMCDYGKTSFENTLDTYRENNISYFAGGYNKSEAWEPLIYETSAGTIAFVGYNKMGPNGVLATESLAGSAYYDASELRAAITAAAQDADIIWLDNHLWPEYGTVPTQEQRTMAQEAIDLGADVVTGVSSHQIQSMTFYNGNAVFYGLGNFLFDQTLSDDTHLGMTVEAFIYDGAIRRLDLHPTRVYDYCQPRFLTGDEKVEMISYFFSISDLE